MFCYCNYVHVVYAESGFFFFLYSEVMNEKVRLVQAVSFFFLVSLGLILNV